MRRYNLSDSIFYRRKKLQIDNIGYEKLINREGTPLVCIMLNRIEKNITILKDILDKEYPNHKLYYALKASYLKQVIETVKNLDVGVEVISELELDIALKANYKFQNTIFNGIGRSGNELYDAILKGITVNIDSVSELKKLISVKSPEEKLKIGLRIHPDFKKDGNFVKRESKLGMDYQETNKCVKLALKNCLEISGLSFHIFSNKTDSTDHLLAVKNVLNYIDKINSDFSVKIKYLDIGGGIAPRMFFENNDKIRKFIRDIAALLKNNHSHLTLMLEPGRYMVSDSTIVLSRINTLKRSGNKLWAILDIGTNYLIPALGNQFKVINCREESGDCLVSFGGGICSPADFIDQIKASKVKEGDYIAVLNAGAYTSVMKEEFVFKSPKHIFIKDSSVVGIINEIATQDVLKYHGW